MISFGCQNEVMEDAQKLERFFDDLKQWQSEMRQFRQIALSCGLVETYKWRSPCYTHRGGNIIVLGAFKSYCTMSFFKGALIQDADGILSKPGENTQSARMAKVTQPGDIQHLAPILRAYLFEAMALEEAGEKYEFKSNSDIEWIAELQEKLDRSPVFKEAFASLTPGRQRAYNMFFGAAKQSKTRVDRIEKFEPRILKGFGMNDCVCGLSKRMPNCDGSHKQSERED